MDYFSILLGVAIPPTTIWEAGFRDINVLRGFKELPNV